MDRPLRDDDKRTGAVKIESDHLIDALRAAAQTRRERLARRFERLLLFDPDNVFWLTGFWKPRDQRFLVLDHGSWTYVSRNELANPPDLERVTILEDGPDWVRLQRKAHGYKWPADQQPPVSVDSTFAGGSWIVASEVETERQVKDSTELALIARNVRVLNSAMRSVARLVRPDASELHIWSELEKLLSAESPDAVEMTGNLATGGVRTLEDDPHPVEKSVQNGDLVLLDAYPRLHGYYADLTRTWLCGVATPRLEAMHAAVAAALEAVASELAPGAVGGDLDRVARSRLEEAGFPGTYGHHTGHGFGVKQQESPWLKPDSWDTIKEGMVIAVEPACYVPGIGGIRLEQDFLITQRAATPLGDTVFSLDPLAGIG